MFAIPDFYIDTPTWEDAVRTIKGRGNGDLLEGMKSMDRIWEEYLDEERAFNAGERDYKTYGDDMDFFEHWCYETNAYNVVFENMSALLAPKKETA